MDKTSVSIIIPVSVALCALVVLSTFIIIAQLAPRIRKKNRIVNRKQFSRRRVEDELLHNVRYASPDSVSVSLEKIQPRSNRRQTLPAISLCQSYSTDSQSEGENTEYGSIELIRSTMRRYSDAGFSKPEPIERTRKISIDSQLLSKICEESSELYEFESRRGSSISQSELDVEMYSSTDEIGSSSMNSGCGLGRLHFIASYNQSIGVFSVSIIKASYVRNSLMKETCCVYVKIGLLPIELNYAKYKTSYVTSMGNPIFNQTFTFQITEIPEQLQMIVKEVRKLESNKVVGYVWFDMTNLLKDNSSTNSSQEISREIFGENKLYRRRGDVLVNLKISINDAIEINVCVAEARNLMIKNQSTSVYVRASVLINHKVQQIKKGQIIKHSISSPTFNDRFRFLIQDSNHCGGGNLDEYCVMLCFCSRSRVRMSRMIGRCIIGPMSYTEGDGLLQWTEAVNRPDTIVSQWLSLT